MEMSLEELEAEISELQTKITKAEESNLEGEQQAALYFELSEKLTKIEAGEDAIRAIKKGIDLLEETTSEKEKPELKSEKYFKLGNLFLQIGYLVDAQKAYDKTLSFGIKEDKGKTLHNLGILQAQEENWKEAVSFIEQAIEADAQIKKEEALDNSFRNLHAMLQNAFSGKTIQEYYQIHLKQVEDSDSKYLLGFWQKNLASWYELNDFPEEALSHFEEALKAQQEQEIKIGLEDIYYHLASLYESTDITKTHQYYKESLNWMFENDHFDNFSIVYSYLNHDLEEIQDEKLVTEIQNLFQKAKDQGLQLNWEEQEQEESFSQQLDFDELVEDIHEQEILSEENLQEAYLTAKKQETIDWEEFTEISEEYLDFLQQETQSFLGGLFGKSKKVKQAEAKFQEIYEEIIDFINHKCEDEEQKEKVLERITAYNL